MKKILGLLFLFVLAFGLAACDPEVEPKPETTLIVGSSTEAGVNMFGTFWGNNATNADVRRLVMGYETVTYQKEAAKYVVDPQVVKTLDTVTNTDGSKTYTITLQEDLVWNDGTKVTAKDYVFAMLLGINPLFGEAIGKTLSTTGKVVGSKDYADKTKNANGLAELPGVDLLGEFKFSITIGAENFPYYYEFTYYQTLPYPLHHIAPNAEVVQGTNGAKLVGITKDEFVSTVEGTEAAPGYRYTLKVSCGPYDLVNFDKTSSTVTLKANPDYKGNYELKKPEIDNIIIKYTTVALQVQQLKSGEINLLPQVSGGDTILSALGAVAYSDGALKFTNFSRNGYGLIGFHCDEPSGPTSSVKVRQAIAYVMNRELFATTYTRGYGVLPHGQYGLAQWMVQRSMDQNGVVQGKDKNGNLVALEAYSYNPTKATELLVADGWIYDATGAAYVQAEDNTSIRHKKVGDTYVPLTIPWGNSSNNPVSDLIRTQLLPNAKKIGMNITDTTMDFNTLLYTHYYGMNGDGYLLPEQDANGKWLVPEYQKKDTNGNIIETDARKYHMVNLGTGFVTGIFEPYYDVSVEYWGWDGGANIQFLYDEEMFLAAEKMMFAATDDEYLTAWQQYQLRFNILLPTLPLYSDLYHAFFTSQLKGYEVTAEWVWTSAVLYANMD